MQVSLSQGSAADEWCEGVVGVVGVIGVAERLPRPVHANREVVGVVAAGDGGSSGEGRAMYLLPKQLTPTPAAYVSD